MAPPARRDLQTRQFPVGAAFLLIPFMPERELERP